MSGKRGETLAGVPPWRKGGEDARIMKARARQTAWPVLAIDGPSGTGKSTIAQRLALRLGCRYVDTGAMYRAVALLARQRGGVSLDDPRALAEMLQNFEIDYRKAAGQWRVFLAGRDITDALRLPGVGEDASRLSRFREVRAVLVDKQRTLAREGAVVMEGRDIGTVVLPNADLKIFLEADETERVARRVRQWEAQGIRASVRNLTEEIRGRDRRDSNRSESPLVPARDAVRLDTTRKTIEEVEEEIVRLLEKRRA